MIRQIILTEVIGAGDIEMLIDTNAVEEVGGTIAQDIKAVEQISFQGTVFSIPCTPPQRVIDTARFHLGSLELG